MSALRRHEPAFLSTSALAAQMPDATPPPTSAYADVVDKLGMIAAPLLSGFSLTLLGIVATRNSAWSMRWPDWAIAALAAAAILFLVAVQFTIAARQFLITREEQKERAPGVDQETLATSYAAMMSDYRRWATRARIAFDLGLAVLLLGLAGVLLPSGNVCTFPAARWVVLAIIAIAFAGELYWLLKDEWSTAKWNRVIADLRTPKAPEEAEATGPVTPEQTKATGTATPKQTPDRDNPTSEA